MRTLLLCFSCYALAAAMAQAATLTPISHRQTVGAVISDIAFPETLADDLASGLQNKLLIRVTVLFQDGPVARAEALFVVKYDLWEERYSFKSTVATQPVLESRFEQTNDVLHSLATLTLEGLFRVEDLPKDRELTMRAELLINPIAREKIDQLREWVAANSAPTDAVRPFTPKPNDLFNRIFEQYTRGAEVAAPWRTTIESAPFRASQSLDKAPR
jgi:hypothetical protein